MQAHSSFLEGQRPNSRQVDFVSPTRSNLGNVWSSVNLDESASPNQTNKSLREIISRLESKMRQKDKHVAFLND